MPVRALLCVVVLVALSACATAKPHTEIPPAPVDGSFEERRSYYKEHDLNERMADHLFLHGGKRIYYPEDLRPAVADDSPTAKAIDEHLVVREKVERWQPFFWVVQGATIVGGIAAIGSLVGLFLGDIDPALDDVGGNLAVFGSIGGLSLMMASLAAILGWQLLYAEETDAFAETADRAWRTYPQSLTDNVGVGVNADGILFDLRKPQKSTVFGVGGVGNALGGLRGDSVPDEGTDDGESGPESDDPADAPPPPPPIEEDSP